MPERPLLPLVVRMSAEPTLWPAWDHLRMTEKIWPGSKVDGHDATVSRVSHARNLWRGECSCGWRGDRVERNRAIADRSEITCHR
jgi:hypothetical protein